MWQKVSCKQISAYSAIQTGQGSRPLLDARSMQSKIILMQAFLSTQQDFDCSSLATHLNRKRQSEKLWRWLTVTSQNQNIFSSLYRCCGSPDTFLQAQQHLPTLEKWLVLYKNLSASSLVLENYQNREKCYVEKLLRLHCAVRDSENVVQKCWYSLYIINVPYLGNPQRVIKKKKVFLSLFTAWLWGYTFFSTSRRLYGKHRPCYLCGSSWERGFSLRDWYNFHWCENWLYSWGNTDSGPKTASHDNLPLLSFL